MGDVVSSFFQLVLELPSKLALDTINKGLGVLEVLLEEVLELKPCDQSGAFVAVLVLSPSDADSATEECGSKGVTIDPCGT